MLRSTAPSSGGLSSKQEKDVKFDPWHRLKSLKKELKASIKELKDEDERNQMKDLVKRLIIHLNSSIERAQGDAKLYQELIFSFLHIQGIHNWTRKRKFVELIQNDDVKVCQIQERKI